MVYIALGFTISGYCPATELVEGITFADGPDDLYIPVAEAARELHWPATFISTRPSELKFIRQLPDGTPLISTVQLEQAGAVTVQGTCSTLVRMGELSFGILRSSKRVEVSLPNQMLQAWQGSRLVFETHISSGRNGSTPTGSFVAGPYKALMHYSRKYDNAPMPWSVQIHGNIFIYGSTSVPAHPASHGCIRVPVNVGESREVLLPVGGPRDTSQHHEIGNHAPGSGAWFLY